ncbi:MAG: hypothetical protein ACI4RS_02815, partial [Monoglobaceae bacterium]
MYVLKGARHCYVLKDGARAALNVVKGFAKVALVSGVGYIIKEAVNRSCRKDNEDISDSAK